MPKLTMVQQDWTWTNRESKFGRRSPPIAASAEVLMHLLDAPKSALHEFKLIFSKNKGKSAQGADQQGEEHLFDSGLSSIGNWLMDIVVIAMIAVVAGAILKWAYVAIFHK
jgi:hypothetical protein